MITSRPAEEIQGELSLIDNGLCAALDELREIAQGIHPSILSRGGLGPALEALARRSPVPVVLELKLDSRLEEPLEVTAYYFAAEALTNAVRHADASVIELRMHCADGGLALSISDDADDDAEPRRRSGVGGLTDRAKRWAKR